MSASKSVLLRSVLVIAATVVLTFPVAAAAGGGGHGVGITFYNEGCYNIKVYTYNGKDDECTFSHSEHHFKNSEVKVMRCHGKGANRCYVTMMGRKGDNYNHKYLALPQS